MNSRWRKLACVYILLADVGLFVWGAMAALLPAYLPGPQSSAILPAEYQGFTNSSWQELVDKSPATADFISLLFRMYGAFNAAFALLAIAIAATAFRRGEAWSWWALLIGNTIAFGSAMTYDRVVAAIGPFEMLEYVAIAGIYAALAIKTPRAATSAFRSAD